MSSYDLITMALRNLFKRKLRTVLTIMGVIIGSASIVIMISLGVGMNANFAELLKQMGNITVITVESEAYWNDSAPKGTPLVDDNNIQGFMKITGVEAVTPVVRGDFQLMSGKYVTWGGILGIDMNLYEALGYKLEQGRTPEPTDTNGVIMGGNVTQNFYNPRLRNRWMSQPTLDPFEDDFQVMVSSIQDDRRKYIVKPQTLTITGVTSKDNNNSYDVYMDIETVKTLNAEKKKAEDKYYKDNGIKNYGRDMSKKGYSQALVKCKGMDEVAAIQEKIRELGFYAWSNAEWLNSMKQTSESMQAFLGIIGGVALFVAAIGITNTMLMSIYERTKEIGVMKVIGATLADIRKIFLVEAALIGFIGGALGLLLSFGFSYVLNNSGGLSFLNQINWNPQGAATKMSIIPAWLCGLALVFSTVVGVVSGYFPARRAMKLSALEAIRAE